MFISISEQGNEEVINHKRDRVVEKKKCKNVLKSQNFASEDFNIYSPSIKSEQLCDLLYPTRIYKDWLDLFQLKEQQQNSAE